MKAFDDKIQPKIQMDNNSLICYSFVAYAFKNVDIFSNKNYNK